jgi:Ni,Fe-hydrogenase III small subunit
MFGILKKSFSTGVVTSAYPKTPAEVSGNARWEPDLIGASLDDVRRAQTVCPTAAIAATGLAATLDLGKCLFCGACARTAPSIRMTNRCELAALHRKDLERPYALDNGVLKPAANPAPSLDQAGEALRAKVQALYGRSLHIREVDAGSCNGCEMEIGGLGSPIYDVERFGLHFVASPRHADMLLVTGPVARNMELALRKTYDAMPGPRLVAAVGACGCSGGIFGINYASRGAVDAVLPVDVYIPGCPPNPHALIYGILLALGKGQA